MKDGDTLSSKRFYLDSSVITKRYCPEEGYGFANALYESGCKLYTAEHAISEVSSAICRKMRKGQLDPGDVDGILDAFFHESIQRFGFIETDSWLYIYSMKLLKKHTLRAGDAVHLSAAMRVYALHPTEFYFVSDDDRQCLAAADDALDAYPVKPYNIHHKRRRSLGAQVSHPPAYFSFVHG